MKVTSITYFGIKAAAFPATCCMEIGECEYEATPVNFEQWGPMKPTTPNGQLPIFTLEDGSVMSESNALSHACAAQAGLLGEGKDAIISEVLLGIFADIAKATYGGGKLPTMMTVGSWDEAKIAAFNETDKPAALQKIAALDYYLQGDKFTSTGLTLGEVSIFCVLYMISNGALPEAVTGKMEAFYNRMLAVPGIKKVIDGESKFGPLGDYCVPLP